MKKIHDDSEMCKFDSKCARILFMYKHSFDQADIIECDANETFQNHTSQKNLNVTLVALSQQIKKNLSYT